MKKLFLFLILILIDSGYTGEKIKIFKPARDVLWGIKRVAVADFKGNDDKVTSLVIEQLKQTKYFDVLSSENVKQKINEQNIDKLAEVCAALEIDGIILGEVTRTQVESDVHGSEKINKKIWTGKYERDQFGKIIEENIDGQIVKKKKFEQRLVDQKYRIRKGFVSITFNLIDGASGKIILSSPITKGYDSGKIPEEEIKSLPSSEQILTDLSNEVVNEFVKSISPKLTTIKRKIEDGEGFIGEGKAYAASNLWADAIETWLKAEKMFPNNSAVYYNLGLAYEAQGDYKDAEIYYKRAYLLKDKKLYKKALNHLRKGRKKKEKILGKSE